MERGQRPAGMRVGLEWCKVKSDPMLDRGWNDGWDGWNGASETEEVCEFLVPVSKRAPGVSGSRLGRVLGSRLGWARPSKASKGAEPEGCDQSSTRSFCAFFGPLDFENKVDQGSNVFFGLDSDLTGGGGGVVLFTSNFRECWLDSKTVYPKTGRLCQSPYHSSDLFFLDLQVLLPSVTNVFGSKNHSVKSFLCLRCPRPCHPLSIPSGGSLNI